VTELKIFLIYVPYILFTDKYIDIIKGYYT